MTIIPKISINLWYATQAEEAANYYCNIFKNSYLGKITRYGKEGYEIHQMPEGSVLTIDFNIEGVNFIALNGGPVFKFNEAVSIVVNCENQEELDYYWEKLTEGGDPSAQQCGWLKDKYGLSWQVVPAPLNDWIADPDRKKSSRVMSELLQMKKPDFDTLEKAYKRDE